MLYLHCGWPRTGTSGLQEALSRFSSELAAVGIVYPDHWRATGAATNVHAPTAPAHHGLDALLRSLAAGEDAGRGFQDVLASHRGTDVLLSTEVLTRWLPRRERPMLLALVALAQDITPVGCLFSLRRMDEFFSSMYTQAFLVRPLPDADDYFRARLGWVRELIGGMSALSDRVSGSITFARYDGGGGHHDHLLRAVGVPPALRRQMVTQLRSGPRIGARLSRKALVSLKHLDAIERRAGCSLAWRRLASAYWSGTLRFEDDGPCVLAAADTRAAVHKHALRASRDFGFAPYPDYFGGEEIPDASETPLEPEMIDERDIERIVACAAPASSRPEA